MRLDLFNNFEVHPCRLNNIEEDGTEVLEQCEEGDKDIYLWSVYGRYDGTKNDNFRGLECLYDFSRKDLAVICAESLKTVLN